MRFQGRFLALFLGFAALFALAAPHSVSAQQPGQAAQDGALGNRVTQIEEQMIDLQVVIGTLQSLVAKGPASPDGQSPALVGAPGSGDLGARVQVMETQIQALSGQISQLTSQLSAISAQLGVAPTTTPDQAVPGRSGNLQLDQQVPTNPAPFGTVTLQQGAPTTPAVPAPVQTAPLAAVPPVQGDSVREKALYDDAYGHLLRRDYGAAESAFQRFLASFPSSNLSGNAQYWLGETYYVRGKYNEAAKAFLDGYKKFGSGNKAPDSLLKLGMALQQLGEKDTACATFGELKSKFPKAPKHIKRRAASEQKRAGC